MFYLLNLLYIIKNIDIIDQLLLALLKELLDWLQSTSLSNSKYADIFKLQNLIFFDVNLSPIFADILIFKETIEYVRKLIQSSEFAYVIWMVTYEFEALSKLAEQVFVVGTRVREEELSLYIRRLVIW